MFKRILPYLLSLLLVLFAAQGFAQLNRPPNPKIRALKIRVVTEHMSLTEQQKQTFLPLYTNYSNELLAVYRAKRALCHSDKSSSYVVNERQALEQKIVSIKGRYKNDFLKIISAAQLEKMYQGEEEFKRLLIERLKKRKKN